jgi:hypothetical protein
MYADDQDPTKLLPGDRLDANIPTRYPIVHEGKEVGYGEIAFDVSTGEYVTRGTITDPEFAKRAGITAGGPFSIATEITTEETP